MKKNTHHITIFFIIAILLCSCLGWKEFPYVKMKSFIIGYDDLHDFNLEITPSGNISIGMQTTNSIICGYESKNDDKILYDSLCKKNNDISYNKKVRVLHGQGYGHIFDDYAVAFATLSNIVGINVTSSLNFDENHLANNSLSDLIDFISYSPKTFIESKYSNFYQWSAIEDSLSYIEPLISDFFPILSSDHPYYLENPFYSIVIRLSESNADIFQLVGSNSVPYRNRSIAPIAYLHFTQVPTLAQTHNLTITITLDDGRVFEKQITKSWE